MRDDETNGVTVPPDDEIWETLVHFSRTPLEPDEAARLQRWVAEDPTRRDMVLAVQRLAAAAAHPAPRRRSEEAWTRVHGRLATGDVEQAPERVNRGAARISGALRATVTDARARRRRARWVVQLAVAAAVVGVVVARAQIRDYVTAWLAARAPMHTLATGIGERIEVRLDDGSGVVLGPVSRLRYGKLTGARTRTVELEGEGYFTVAPDRAHPFTVLAGTAAVQAVGTAFDVRAYAGDSVVRVVTTHGRVALRPRAARGQLGTLVDRGQQGTLDESGFAVVTAADTGRAVGWMRDRVSYDLAPLPSLLRDLERRYDLRFELNDLNDTTLRSMRVTITFDHATADEVVEQLAATIGARAHRTGDVVELGVR